MRRSCLRGYLPRLREHVHPRVAGSGVVAVARVELTVAAHAALDDRPGHDALLAVVAHAGDFAAADRDAELAGPVGDPAGSGVELVSALHEPLLLCQVRI